MLQHPTSTCSSLSEPNKYELDDSPPQWNDENETKISNEIIRQPSFRIDHAVCKSILIAQQPNVSTFSTDSILLSSFVPFEELQKKKSKIRPNQSLLRIVDLCTGNGIVPMLLLRRLKLQNYNEDLINIKAVEIQDEIISLTRKTIELNSAEKFVEIVHADLTRDDFVKDMGEGLFDIVTCNPPYFRPEEGITNQSICVSIAKFEIKCSLSDIVKTSARLLRNGGKLVMVHRASRLTDIMVCLREHRLEPRRMQLVYSRRSKRNVQEKLNGTTALLIEAVKEGDSSDDLHGFLNVLEPIFLYNGNHYSDDMIDNVLAKFTKKNCED